MNSWKFRLTKTGRQSVTDGRGREGGREHRGGEGGRKEERPRKHREVRRDRRDDENISEGMSSDRRSLCVRKLERD